MILEAFKNMRISAYAAALMGRIESTMGCALQPLQLVCCAAGRVARIAG